MFLLLIEMLRAIVELAENEFDVEKFELGEGIAFDRISRIVVGFVHCMLRNENRKRSFSNGSVVKVNWIIYVWASLKEMNVCTSVEIRPCMVFC